jgi:hypothetical protein
MACEAAAIAATLWSPHNLENTQTTSLSKLSPNFYGHSFPEVFGGIYVTHS